MRAAEGASPPGLRVSPEPLTITYDCALLDLDGVVYVGSQAIDGVADVLAQANAQGMSLAFVTNNASRPPAEIADQLTGMGIAAGPQDVVTSAQAAATEVASRVAPGSRVMVVGGEGLVSALAERGLVAVESSRDDPAAVLQGFGADVSWRDLADAAVAIRAGAIWIASNTDLTIPTSSGPAPGNGALVNAVAAAVGRRPAAVAGKPYRPLFDESIARVGCSRPIVVGDRLDTDIEGASRVNADSLVVMTGVTDLEALCSAPPHQRPTYVAWTLRGLLTPHPVPTRSSSGEQWSLGGWSVSMRDQAVQVTSRGPGYDDGLRAVVAACWSLLDADPLRKPCLDAAERAFAELR